MDELVKHLSAGKHKVTLDRYKSGQDLKEAIDRGFVLMNFPDTRGGTLLGTTLDKSRCELSLADFGGQTGQLKLVGSLVLNYNDVELSAEIDLASREGMGMLTLIADETAWRASKAPAEATGSASATSG
jgi:hypothetical protein